MMRSIFGVGSGGFGQKMWLGGVSGWNAGRNPASPSGVPHMWHDPEGPYPYGPGTYPCIRLDRNGCFDVKQRPPFRPVPEGMSPDRPG
jgi:hypothetical protein